MTQDAVGNQPVFRKWPLVWAMRSALIGTIIVWIGAITSCLLQLERQRVTVQGMLIIWPGNGLVTAGVKILMYGGLLFGLKRAVQTSYVWTSRMQYILILTGAILLTGTNLALLINLLRKGVPVWHWTTQAALLVAIIPGLISLFGMPGMSRSARLFVLLIGINFIPTFLQGISFLLYGAKGMPWQPCVILVVLAYAMYLQALPQGKGHTWKERFISPGRRMRLATDAEFLLLKWDLLVQLFTFGLCWLLAAKVPAFFPLLK